MNRIRLLIPALAISFLPAYGQQPMRLTLAEAQRLAVQNNPQYSAARFSALAAYQVAPQYRAGLGPTLSGAVTGVGADAGSRLAAGFLNNPTLYNRVASGLSASQLITDFGRIGNLSSMAKQQAQAQDQATEATRADILLATSAAYFSVLRSEAVLQVANQTVDTRQQVSEQVTVLAQNQQRSTLDVSFANVNLADAKLLQVQAQNAVKAAEATLALAMGLPSETAFVLTEEPMPTPLPAQFGDLVTEAIQNRPELKDLRLQQSAAESFTKAEHDLYYPSVAMVGAAGFAPRGDSAVASRYGAIGLNINIPIFNGGLFKARQTEAELKAKAAAQNVNTLANSVTRDVHVAYLNAETAFQRMALTQQLLDQAKLSLDLAQTRYTIGLSTIVELSQAQLNLTSAQIADASAKYDYQSQRVLVDYQIGALR